MKICNNPKCDDRGTEYEDDMQYCPTCNNMLEIPGPEPKPKPSPRKALPLILAAVVVVAGAAAAIGMTARGRRPTNPDFGVTGRATTKSTEKTKDDGRWWDIYPEEIEIGGPATVGLNETSQLKVEYIKPHNTTIMNELSWVSDDTSVLEIDSGGRVTGHRLGAAKVTVTVEGENGARISAELPMRVVIPVVSITVSGDTSLEQTKSGKLSALVLPADATDREVEWTSSDPSVVSIDKEGNIKAGELGTATITAKAGEKSTEVTVTITELIIHVTSVSLSGPSTLDKGRSGTMSAAVSPANATYKNVTYTSSDSSVVSVDSAGRITALKKGSATITATADGKSASKSVKVIVPVTSISITGPSTVGEGSRARLVMSVSPSDASMENITYSSSNSSVVSVGSDGYIQGVNSGQAVITARADGVSGSITIRVNVPVTGVSIGRSSMSVYEGSSGTLSATVYPYHADNRGVTWTSGNPFVVAMYSNGEWKAINRGQATITVKTKDGGYTDTIVITVN